MSFISRPQTLSSRRCLLLFLASTISTSSAAVALVKGNPRETSHQPGSANVAQKPSRSRITLGTFKVDAKGDLSYELSIAPCADKQCSFQVRLLEGTNVWASLDLEWAKARGPATKGKVDESSGVGDPLQPESQQTAWSTGEEKENVSTVGRTIRLTPELNGLLIDQRAGFDHLKRHHYLFVALEKKLGRAWEQEEGAGPTWSTVEIANSARDGSERILYFSGFRYPSDDQPDWLDLSVYRWNHLKNELQLKAPELPSVFAVVAGTYPTVTKAREVQESNPCLGAFWVLKSDVFSELSSGKFVLAAVTYKGPIANRKSESVMSCDPHSTVSVMRSSYGRTEGK
jgi:hypothetical protein